MTGPQRREQLIEVGRAAFADRGFDAISVEEIATRAGVSKPVLYEHFGGKEGLYRAVVETEHARLYDSIVSSIGEGRWRERIENGILALLTYVEDHTDGFVLLVHGQLPGGQRSYSTLMNTVTEEVSFLLGEAFLHRGLDSQLAALHAQAIVGAVSLTALWWLDQRSPDKFAVATHVANLCWNGLAGLEAQPKIIATAKGIV
ncbi:TetR family transcriptional regulator [Corynebacterium liangguodongii]|uniref:TetR family transcriptional regulator n=2 Tax=Corynebacterium liangguodongii TaxID=2079535 RepID=A0A2S0WD75_9CORY|nr:TetR family transcriptional regulator [Corynebacterium liangguodongii]PWB99467.1 TetR/AcrR family transcriptional regulator [Corynebacterium liangguodongii]